MRWWMLPVALAFVLPTGCAQDTAPTPNEVEWLSADGHLETTTPEGRVVYGMPTPEGGLRFWIEDGARSFGFELAEDHMYEWSVEEGTKHDLRIEYEPGSEDFVYVANGRRFTRPREEVLRLQPAKANAQGRAFFQEPLGLDYRTHRVYRNELGDALVRELAARNAELAQREDGEKCGDIALAVTVACALAKCPFGGALNSVCVGCSGASLGCLFVRMMG